MLLGKRPRPALARAFAHGIHMRDTILPEPLRRSLAANDHGMFTHLAWAIGTCLVGSSPASAGAIQPEFEEAAARGTGLLTRWETCTLTDRQARTRRGTDRAEDIPSKGLHKMIRAESGQCVRLPGATIQLGTGYSTWGIATLSMCYYAFHIRRRFLGFNVV